MRFRQRLKRHLQAVLGERARAIATRASYAARIRPRLNAVAGGTFRYRGDRPAALVLSADLELAWAWRYARNRRAPLAFARLKAAQGRRNLPRLLDLLDAYDLPATWATVGHLFLDQCSRIDGVAHPEVPRVPYFENQYWAYKTGDWFEADPGCTQPGDPSWADWYGRHLVRVIMDRPTRHEIGCHSFSHAILTDEHCPPSVAAAELFECQAQARTMGLMLRSLVFPGNLGGNYASVRAAGFAAYRWHGEYEVDIPTRDEFGLWRIPGGFCLERPYSILSAKEQIKRARLYIDAAIKHGLLCGFWFHPEMSPSDADDVCPGVFEYIAARRSDIWVSTMGDLAEWLDGQCQSSEPTPELIRPDSLTTVSDLQSAAAPDVVSESD